MAHSIGTEPTRRGVVVRDRTGSTWVRTNNGVWRWRERPTNNLGKLRWGDLWREYGPLVEVSS